MLFLQRFFPSTCFETLFLIVPPALFISGRLHLQLSSHHTSFPPTVASGKKYLRILLLTWIPRGTQLPFPCFSPEQLPVQARQPCASPARLPTCGNGRLACPQEVMFPKRAALMEPSTFQHILPRGPCSLKPALLRTCLLYTSPSPRD